jgi:GST-like protein
MKRWLEAIYERPAVKRGLAVNAEDRKLNDLKDPAIQAVLFGQRAR